MTGLTAEPLPTVEILVEEGETRGIRVAGRLIPCTTGHVMIREDDTGMDRAFITFTVYAERVEYVEARYNHATGVYEPAEGSEGA